MKKEDYELMRDFDRVKTTIRDTQKLYDDIEERLHKKGLGSFTEFFKPCIGKCYRKIDNRASDTGLYIKILEHLGSNCLKVLQVASYGMCTIKISPDDFPESYKEISIDEFEHRAAKWFKEQMSQ